MAAHIFIIDDDPIDQFVAKRVISSVYTESTIEVFSQADLALDKLRWLIANEASRFPGIIFLDINMPIMNGFGFLEEFTELLYGLNASCRVIILSSSLHEEDISKAMAHKVVKTYISKPITTQIIEYGIALKMGHK
jgi:DNA-binding NarL/FixJ family response regulator